VFHQGRSPLDLGLEGEHCMSFMRSTRGQEAETDHLGSVIMM
jgi:hypothetical protein